ncbi:MAG: hypothetical protein HY369_02500 [Candidatus Aenigmarchaeota archaeon]|nr:hypothetical protein [Candidatus Aenigmarchaeota archaeon]
MKDQNFLKTSEMVVLGLLSVVLGLLILIAALPAFKFAGMTAVMSTFLFLVVWLVIYIGLVIAAMVVYFFKPQALQPPKTRRKK